MAKIKFKKDKDTFQLEETNRFRVSQGLSPIVRKDRKCLKCEKVFRSEGASNRMCYSCATNSTNIEE